MKKNILRVSALVLVVLMLTMMLASCGGLSGTYTSGEVLGSGVSYTFKGSKVTIETKALGSVISTVEGKYKIDGDKITFTFSDSDDAEKYSGTFDFVKGDDSIKIGLVTYTKSK